VLQGQREADKIWSKEGFYAVVIFLSIFVILVTCLMVSFLFTCFCCSLLLAFLNLKGRVKHSLHGRCLLKAVKAWATR